MFSVAITAYNELTPLRDNGRHLLRAINAVHDHDAVEEIVVVDDASQHSSFDDLVELLDDIPKVSVHQNQVNLGVFGNKLEAIAKCSADWVINCDSDNCMSHEFIERLLAEPLSPSAWYCPSFARPKFDYRSLIGEWSWATAGRLVEMPMAGCLVNTGNQTVHREMFMEVFEHFRGERPDLKMPNWLKMTDEERQLLHARLVYDAKDSLIYNMEWLGSGNRLVVVAGLEYDHSYSGGLASSYARAPKEKDDLDGILIDAVRNLGKEILHE